jgi:hypothetical protein
MVEAICYKNAKNYFNIKQNNFKSKKTHIFITYNKKPKQ